MPRAHVDNDQQERVRDKRSAFADLLAEDQTLGLKLIAASPDCVQLIDTSGKLRFVNDNGLKLLEVDDPDSIDGMDWLTFWPSGVGKAEQALKKARTGSSARFSGMCPTLKGTPKWWDVWINPITDDAGNITWLLAVQRDISSQKFAEKALRVSEDRFRALADNIAQFAWMADPSGYIFWYNKRWFDYTGTTFEDMAGWGWQAVHHPDHVDRVTAKFVDCISRGDVWEDTFPLRGEDGQYRWFLSRAMPIRDKDGTVTLWCGTNTDITDQRNASQRLRQLARLVELSHEAILVRSPEFGILLWNRGCEDLYGYTQAEAIGKDVSALLKTKSTFTEQKISELLENEGSWSGEISRQAKDGSAIWVDVRKQVLRSGDSYVILETDHDITGRKKADEIRNLLVAELNHRVKNTLAIIQSLASQTARTARTKDEFVTSFTGRLQSLSSAHNVLTDRNWASASVGKLVADQMAVVGADSTRVLTSGPDVDLPPQLALQLTLMLHELAANAVQHGALSGLAGTVSISWDVTNKPQPRLALSWVEQSNNTVKAPKSCGFGLSLIERSSRLPYIDSDIQFERSGLVCHIYADIQDELRQSDFFDPSKKRQPLHN